MSATLDADDEYVVLLRTPSPNCESCTDDSNCEKIRLIYAEARPDMARCIARNGVRYFTILVGVLVAVMVLESALQSGISSLPNQMKIMRSLPMIIVITPTYRRTTRLADMTRMANTLQQVPNVHWIVIEDNDYRVRPVEMLLNRTGLAYTYMPVKTKPGYPRRGWYQRDSALGYLRNHTDKVTQGQPNAVVYFGDDDNAYDLRLFNDYIRNVKKAGVWGVGLVGQMLVESPKVVDEKVVSWNVNWNPKRKFATDMAGFAVSLDVVLNSTAVFGTSCKRGAGAPETCLLEDLGLTINDLEPFGFDVEKDREVLVWHTKTIQGKYDKRKQDVHGYLVE